MIVEGVGQRRLISVEAIDRGGTAAICVQVLCRENYTEVGGVQQDAAGPWVPEATITLDVNHAEALELAIRAARLEAEARSKSL